MEVRNCRSCGRLFNYMGAPLCPACQKKLEEKFQEVKAFLEENRIQVWRRSLMSWMCR